MLDMLYSVLFFAALILLAVFVFLCLLRAIIGPKVADRIVAANMIGTMVMVIIGIFAVKSGEGYLVDICIIYAMISFLAVIVLTKVYTGVYMESKMKNQDIDIDTIDEIKDENTTEEEK